MTHRAALVGIVVEDTASIPKMNEILSDYSAYIVGRMGLPYRERGVSIISVVLDAPDNVSVPCPEKSACCPEFLQRQSIPKYSTTRRKNNHV